MDIDFAEEERQQAEEDLIVEATSMAVIGAANAVIEYGQAHFDKTPYHNSAFTGAAWVSELLRGHPKRIRKELEVDIPVFWALIDALQG